MFWFYISILVLGCGVDTSFAVRISPPNPCINCYYPDTCQEQLELTCHDDAETEWLDENSRLITTTDNTARIHIEGTTLVFLSRQSTDEGNYTCRNVRNQNIKASVQILVKDDSSPHFTYSCNPNSRYFSDQQTALRYQDNFINCSYAPTATFSVATYWDYGGRLLNTAHNSKYSQNTSGLIIHYFTEADQGIYKCLIGNGDPLTATINVVVGWPPELLSEQNQTVLVNVSEQVVLNCAVSSSPDPVYNWSIPDTCSSCPHTNNDSTMTFTVNITDSGEYVCEAGNEYGRILMTFDIKVLTKPILLTESNTIIKDERENIILTCDLEYGYPVPNVTWSIKSVLSNNYIVIKNSSVERGYSLHDDFSIEIFHRFLSEAGYLNVMCSVENLYGSDQMVYHLWEDAAFKAKIDFTLYVTNFASCQEVKRDRYGLFTELLYSLREWFNSVCHCNGHNNLYTPQLTCLNSTTGYITSIVQHEGDNSAQQLIDLVVATVTNNTVNLSQHGWMLFLGLLNDTENTTPPVSNVSDAVSDTSGVPIAVLIGTTVGVIGAIAALILCIAAIAYGVHKRQVRDSTTDTNSSKGVHIYDDVNRFTALKLRNTDDEKNKSNLSPTEMKVVFEMDGMQPPAYRPLSKPLYDNPVCTRKKSNDYQIDDGVENAKKDKNNQFQKGEKYDKLFHYGP